MKSVNLYSASSPQNMLTVKVCSTFLSRLRGLMLSEDLSKNGGIILMGSNPSRINSAIHTLFMKYDITVLWLDKNRVIVDKTLAKHWRPFYMPRKPAQYVVELHQERFEDYAIGEELVWH